MKKNRIISNLLAVLAVATVCASVCILCMAIHAPPVLVGQPVAAIAQVEEMLSAVCSGDFETISSMLYGNPNLGICPEGTDPAEDLLWSAYLESMEFEIPGDCYAGDSGVAVDVRIRTLDISCAVDGLGDRARKLLNSRMEMAESLSELYDENNDFRQEIIAEVLQEAMAESLKENKIYQEQTVVLDLVFEQGEWWILPDEDILNILSGSISD